jgi:hypothetical protein
VQLKQVKQVNVELLKDWQGFKAGQVVQMYPGSADAMERFGNGRILGKRTTADSGQVDHGSGSNSGTAATVGGEKAPRNRRR